MCGSPCVQSVEGPLEYNQAVGASQPASIHHSLLTRCPKGKTAECANRFLGQLRSWQACLEAAEGLERSGRAVGAIIALRSDLVWYGRFPTRGLKLTGFPYFQARRATAPLDRTQSNRLSACSMDPQCSFVPHEVSDWAFAVPRRLADAAFGAAREYCDACRRPNASAFWVPSRVEDFLLGRVARAALARAPGGQYNPMLHPMPAIVLRGEAEDPKRQVRACALVSPTKGFSVCATRLRERCWGPTPVTADSFAAALTAAELGLPQVVGGSNRTRR